MNRLPPWNIPVHSPAAWDVQSGTVTEQTARLYDAMNQLIEEYNKTVEQISAFEKSEQEQRTEYETKLTKVIREFMCNWEQKMNDIPGMVTDLINEAIKAGSISITEEYDPEKESLNMSVTGGV